MLWMIANSLPGCSEQKVWHAKSAILSQLALSVRLVDVIPTVETAVKDMMLSEDAAVGDDSSLGQMIETYIQGHFTEQFRMDTLASHFGFSLACLTCIFKNYKQESPLKYLLSLRMNRALELMLLYCALERGRDSTGGGKGIEGKREILAVAPERDPVSGAGRNEVMRVSALGKRARLEHAVKISAALNRAESLHGHSERLCSAHFFHALKIMAVIRMNDCIFASIPVVG